MKTCCFLPPPLYRKSTWRYFQVTELDSPGLIQENASVHSNTVGSEAIVLDYFLES
jgi:hypothetical protein